MENITESSNRSLHESLESPHTGIMSQAFHILHGFSNLVHYIPSISRHHPCASLWQEGRSSIPFDCAIPPFPCLIPNMLHVLLRLVPEDKAYAGLMIRGPESSCKARLAIFFKEDGSRCETELFCVLCSSFQLLHAFELSTPFPRLVSFRNSQR